jgi:hypothetical protein
MPGAVIVIVCVVTARAIPKSESLTTSSLVTRMFAGLTSRCRRFLTVRVGEPAADLSREVDRDGFGQRAVVLDHLGERRPSTSSITMK